MKEWLSWLDESQWRYQLRKNQTVTIIDSIQAKYGVIPNEYLPFFDLFESCSNDAETAWFMCLEDFEDHAADTAFSANSFEEMSLEGAITPEAIAKIKQFWQRHFPIFYSLHNGYEYYAIDTQNGEMIYGYEPIFEDYEVVAASFSDFIEQIISGKIIL
ncbi:SMI1/KNR4 family protein [Isobaculum melis]|uniref:SMI1 / KNR4 family (SUKH-1) n=1 Tax=Isobaculum melis TaxID=142588 RepID=A0A1H9QQC5_9LACT|nr:SMI1/KNR4 family protein [Isobaculum melis]SER62039.1 SMI1 / KNR4 family (SUKH-1) [Isobaculum melis]